MDKKLLNRILEIEEIFPKKDYNTEEYIAEVVNNIEMILGHKINDRINLNEIDYMNKDTIEISIFKFLTVDELRYIAYM